MLCCLEIAICKDYCLVAPSYQIGLQKDETNSLLIWFNLQELLPFIVNWIRKRSEGLLSYVTTVAPELNGQRDEGSLATPPLHQTHIPETISNIRGLKYSHYEDIDVGKGIWQCQIGIRIFWHNIWQKRSFHIISNDQIIAWQFYHCIWLNSFEVQRSLTKDDKGWKFQKNGLKWWW